MLPLSISSLLLLLFCGSAVAVKLETKQGTLEGLESLSRNKTKYLSFLGIPFAKPPIGELRFAPPQEAEPWKGVRDATQQPNACIQEDLFSLSMSLKGLVIGSEDCLYLNVFTPNVKPSALMPVMFHIHSGAFHSASCSVFGPDYFMDHPIVMVFIQYRLGILGFLSAADEVLPGNYGLKDQTAALKWVQKNIEVFGGDPKRVTILGSSAGGISTHLHTHSPLNTGLFHRVICQSGTALSPLTTIKPHTAKERALDLGKQFKCPSLETKALVECLRKVPAKEMALAYKNFFFLDTSPVILFGPVVEPSTVKDAFLLKNPWQQSEIHDLPLLAGVNADEGMFIAHRILSKPTVLKEWMDHYERVFPYAFGYFDITEPKDSLNISTLMKKFYFKDQPIGMETRKNFVDIFTDAHFGASSLEAARRHKSEVFFYLFDHQLKSSLQRIFGNLPRQNGTCHGDEMLILFRVALGFPALVEGPDFVVSKRMIDYWVNFAKNGDPNGETKVWKPFTPEKFEYLRIKTDKDVMEEKLFYDRYLFWKDLLFAKYSGTK